MVEEVLAEKTATEAATLTLDDGVGPGRPALQVVDDPSLLRCKPIARTKAHSNVAACVWKMSIFTWRNKS